MRKTSLFLGIACILTQYFGCGGRSYEPHLDESVQTRWIAEPSARITDIRSEEHTFRVRVDYVDIPDFDRLNGTFFDWCHRTWDRGASNILPFGTTPCPQDGVVYLCYPPKVEEVPGEKEFILKRYDRVVGHSEVLVWAKERGLQQVSLKELLAFAASYPKMQQQYPIHSFGSFVYLSNGGAWMMLFPVLTGNAEERALSTSSSVSYRAGEGFLFLRK